MTTPTEADRQAAERIAQQLWSACSRFEDTYHDETSTLAAKDASRAQLIQVKEKATDAIAQLAADARAVPKDHVRITIENMPNGKTGIECIPNLSDFDQSPAATLARKMLKAVGIKRPGNNGDWLLTKDKRRLKLTTDDEAALAARGETKP